MLDLTGINHPGLAIVGVFCLQLDNSCTAETGFSCDCNL